MFKERWKLGATAATAIIALCAFGAGEARAGACPNVGTATAGCDLIITLNPGGTGTITNGPSHTIAGGTYDGSDDTLIGVVNNSGQTVNSIFLNGGTNNIFGFENDGIAVNPNPTSGLQGLNGTGSFNESNAAPYFGYAGTVSTNGNDVLTGTLIYDTFTNIAGNTGDVNFPGGLASGGTAFFSLEQPLDMASFTVTTNNVPEPASLAIFGTALAGLGLVRRRRKNV